MSDPNCTTNTPLRGSCPDRHRSNLWDQFPHQLHAARGDGCVGPTGAVACETARLFSIRNWTHLPTVCDVGDGVCRTSCLAAAAVNQPGAFGSDQAYTSQSCGDAGNPSNQETRSGAMAWRSSDCLRAMAPAATCTASGTFRPSQGWWNKLLSPLENSPCMCSRRLPLNGEHDGGGGIDVLSPMSRLGHFNLILFDDAAAPAMQPGQRRTTCSICL